MLSVFSFLLATLAGIFIVFYWDSVGIAKSGTERNNLLFSHYQFRIFYTGRHVGLFYAKLRYVFCNFVLKMARAIVDLRPIKFV